MKRLDRTRLRTNCIVALGCALVFALLGASLIRLAIAYPLLVVVVYLHEWLRERWGRI